MLCDYYCMHTVKLLEEAKEIILKILIHTIFKSDLIVTGKPLIAITSAQEEVPEALTAECSRQSIKT